MSKMKKITKKVISVVSGYFASIPIFYSDFYRVLSPVIQATILCIFFIFYYYLIDRIFDRIEKRGAKNDRSKS